MKNAKKVLILVLCAALLVGASVMGTLAFLQYQTGTVKNTFTVGHVKITLQEYAINVETGVKTDNTTLVTGLENVKLVPNRVIEKNPFVTVEANSEKCYLYVKVVNYIAGVESAETATYKTVEQQMAANGWLPLDGVDDVYYMIVETNAANQNKNVFEKFMVKPEATNDALAAVSGKTIELTAYAVQFEGFDNAKDAWTKAAFN